LTEQTNKHTVKQIPRPSLYERMAGKKNRDWYNYSGTLEGARLISEHVVRTCVILSTSQLSDRRYYCQHTLKRSLSFDQWSCQQATRHRSGYSCDALLPTAHKQHIAYRTFTNHAYWTSWTTVYTVSDRLSQKDRATLLVIEYFATSLKVIRNDTVE